MSTHFGVEKCERRTIFMAVLLCNLRNKRYNVTLSEFGD